MNNKKALIVVNLAGFINFLWNDIKCLQLMGYEVSIAMNEKLKDGSDAVEVSILEKMNIQHYNIDFDSKNPLAIKNIKAYKQLCEILKNGYKLIHCHTPIAGVFTRIAANKYRHKGAKVIYTTHGFPFTDRTSKKSWFIYYNIENIMSYFCDAIITINHEDYNNAKKMHCNNVFIIPSVGLDNEKFKNLKIDRNIYRKKIGIEENDIMILAVGELSVRKNHQIIIKAIAKLPDRDKYNFVICGRAIVNSNIDLELKNLAKQLGVRIKMLGHRADIPEINACADVAVIPSLREGFGMAGVEAMASGVPVIGSNVQGIREYIISEKTGYLCDPIKEKEFAEAIYKIINMDLEKKKVMCSECKAMALNFDVSKSKIEMEKIYKYILESEK